MTTHLNLIKSEVRDVEKRVFPRFPFAFMTFKDANCEKQQVYEVVDISLTGMQVSLKNGAHQYRKDSEIEGYLHWKGAELNIEGKVKWTSGHNVGIEFNGEQGQYERVQSFLSIDNIIRGMKALHNSELGLEIPSNLKYWLRADGPYEIFLWQHNDGELARFQVIMLNQFIEWEDGKGVRTGNVLKRRDIDSPLNASDEFLFEIDEITNEEKLNEALTLVGKIPASYLPDMAVEFLTVKLGGQPATV